ncbi:MAG: hypothetical protein WKF35_07860 [Ferruginibacter sp.]
MKKFWLSIITIIYLTVASGIGFTMHFCMGESLGTALYNSDDGKCGRCGMPETGKGCCSEKTAFYKLTEEHKYASNDYSFSVDLQGIQLPLIVPHNYPPVKNGNYSICPMPDTGPPVYLVNRNFRI